MKNVTVIKKQDLRSLRGGFTQVEEVKGDWFRIDAEDFEEKIKANGVIELDEKGEAGQLVSVTSASPEIVIGVSAT